MTKRLAGVVSQPYGIIYIRVSDDDQVSDGDQIGLCQERAALMGVPIPDDCIYGWKGCHVRDGELSSKNETVWIVGEDELKILRMMYEWAAAGIGLNDVSRRVTALGVRTEVRTVKRGKNAGKTIGGTQWSK